jgi:hypothetical protein
MLKKLRENATSQGGECQDGASGPAPEATRDRSSKFLDFCHGIFRLAPVSEPTGSGRPGGPDPYSLRERQRVREQGISKAGNRRVRTLGIEIAWVWRGINHEAS